MLFAQTPELKHRAGAGADGLLLWLLLLPLLLLAVACGQQRGYVEYGAPTIGGTEYAPSHYYPPPGPPGDPWGPYIREAAGRYGVPEQWVRAVMKQESGGQEQAISPVGAMGLMQVMPATYDGLRARYGLGADPYDPHNNILAGTAYIREMYDRFGAPAFLAAYNAGPDRVEAYLVGAGSLPDETQNYLASVSPNLGSAVPMSGPLAVYASAGTGRHRGGHGIPDVQSLAAGCDLSAAYNPSHPCTSLMRASTTPAPVQQAYLPQTALPQAALPQTGAGGCDLNAAYDPSRPCTSVGGAVRGAVGPVIAAAATATASPPSAPPVRQASIQPAAGCDLNAAYDPSRPCTSAGQAVVAAAETPLPLATPARSAALGGCDPDAAYDPNRPCHPASPIRRVQLASAERCDATAAYDPASACHQAVTAASAPSSRTSRAASEAAALLGFPDAVSAPAPRRPVAPVLENSAGLRQLALPNREWAIQVGAFASPGLARAVAEGARAQAPGQLHAATIALPPVAAGGAVLYRARLVNLSASAAENACTNLNRRQLPCVVVQPNRG